MTKPAKTPTWDLEDEVSKTVLSALVLLVIAFAAARWQGSHDILWVPPNALRGFAWYLSLSLALDMVYNRFHHLARSTWADYVLGAATFVPPYVAAFLASNTTTVAFCFAAFCFNLGDYVLGLLWARRQAGKPAKVSEPFADPENGIVIKQPVAPARKAQSWLSSVFGNPKYIKINPPSLRVVSDVYGLPLVEWWAVESKHLNEDETKKWQGYDWHCVCHRYRAFVDVDNGNFVVTRDVFARYRRNEKALFTSDRLLAVGENCEHTILCDLPADNLKAFMDGLASEHELVTSDLAHFRAGKLWFDDHNLIRVEFIDGQFGTISRDVQERSLRDNIIVQLVREFIVKRPPGGWSSKVAALQEQISEKRSQEQNAAENAARWAKPQPLPVVHAGRKFAAFETQQRQPDQFLKPIEAADVAKQSVMEAVMWRSGSHWSFYDSNALIQTVRSCLSDGVAVDRTSVTLVRFFPPPYTNIEEAFGDMIEVAAETTTAIRIWRKQMSKLTDIKLATANDLVLPPVYFADNEVAQSPDAVIAYLEFADGEIVPLTYTTKMQPEAIASWIPTLQEALRTCALPFEDDTATSAPAAVAAASSGYNSRLDFDPI